MKKVKTSRLTRLTRLICNILLAAMVAAGWLIMVFGGEGMLSTGGLASLKYYTTLSNVLEGIASLVWLAVNASGKASERAARWTDWLKYAACVCVGLTFVTVMVFLGPMYGYPFMFTRANFFFHLTVPLLAMAEFICFNRQAIGWKENAAAVLPTLLYGGIYLVNILVNGLGDDPFQRDIYGFVTWGMPIGIVIFSVICVAAFLIGAALRLGNRRFGQKEQPVT